MEGAPRPHQNEENQFALHASVHVSCVRDPLTKVICQEGAQSPVGLVRPVREMSDFGWFMASSALMWLVVILSLMTLVLHTGEETTILLR